MGAKKYFCVSTDKAANPVNMMGASKRIMEMFLMRESLTQKFQWRVLPMWLFQMALFFMDLINDLLKNSRSQPQMMFDVIL